MGIDFYVFSGMVALITQTMYVNVARSCENDGSKWILIMVINQRVLMKLPQFKKGISLHTVSQSIHQTMAYEHVTLILLAIIFRVNLAKSPIEPAILCNADNDCGGFLVNQDGTSNKIRSELIAMARIKQTLWTKTPAGQGVNTFTKVPATIASEVRRKATKLGFDKEVKYQSSGLEFSKFYKVFKDQPQTYFPKIEKQCLKNHGILPVADMTEAGLKKMCQTLVPDALDLIVGLKKYLVSGSTYRLSWTNGVIVGEGSKAEYDASLAQLGLVNKDDGLNPIPKQFGYINSVSGICYTTMHHLLIQACFSVPTGDLHFTHAGGYAPTFVCEFMGTKELATGKKLLQHSAHEYDPPCKPL